MAGVPNLAITRKSRIGTPYIVVIFGLSAVYCGLFFEVFVGFRTLVIHNEISPIPNVGLSAQFLVVIKSRKALP